jgi:hypothetical protein
MRPGHIRGSEHGDLVAQHNLAAQESTCTALLTDAQREAVAELAWCAIRASGPVGFRNSAIVPDLGIYAARSYSLIRPPRTGRRLIRSWERSAGG